MITPIFIAGGSKMTFGVTEPDAKFQYVFTGVAVFEWGVQDGGAQVQLVFIPEFTPGVALTGLAIATAAPVSFKIYDKDGQIGVDQVFAEILPGNAGIQLTVNMFVAKALLLRVNYHVVAKGF